MITLTNLLNLHKVTQLSDARGQPSGWRCQCGKEFATHVEYLNHVAQLVETRAKIDARREYQAKEAGDPEGLANQFARRCSLIQNLCRTWGLGPADTVIFLEELIIGLVILNKHDHLSVATAIDAVRQSFNSRCAQAAAADDQPKPPEPPAPAEGIQ